MKVFIPTNKNHPNLILTTNWPSHNFLDDLKGKDWTDFSDDSKVGKEEISHCTIKYLGDLYDYIRKAIRSHYKYAKLADRILSNSNFTPQSPNYNYYKNLFDKYNGWGFDNKQAQDQFWQRCQDELVVKEYGINPFTMEMEPIKTHEFRSISPKKPSKIY